METNFKLPPAKRDKTSALTEAQELFLDMTFFLPMPDYKVYQMVYPNITDAMARTKSSAVKTSFDGKDYLERRKRQLDVHFGFVKEELSDDEKEAKAQRTTEDIMAKVIELAGDMLYDDKNPDKLDVVKMFLPKVLKDREDEIEEAGPIRYLATSCSECRYRQFCEENLEDDCSVCKYRMYANDNGVFYTHKNQLKHENMD